MQVQFKEWPCKIEFAEYDNGRTAITLHHAQEFDQVAVATVNLPDVPLNDNEVIVKDWSENEGMLQTLYDAGIISWPVREVRTGFVVAYVCLLLRTE